MQYTLFEPVRIGPLYLKNRFVRSATNEHLSTRTGQLTPEWVKVQRELAAHEVGLVITGHMTVDRTQRADEGQVVLDDQIDRALFAQAADGVHRCGARLLAQISHSGLKGMAAVNGQAPKGPDDFTPAELDRLAEQFVEGAVICREAGLDGVQVHNAHGYLLSSFLNPKENHRPDEYGGSLDNRFRLVRRILTGIRKACGPDFALLVKTDANGCGDLRGLLERYQSAGVDGVEVSGLDFAMRKGQKEPFYLRELLQARSGIEVPLFPVGGVFSRASAEQILAAGFPLVSCSRSLICQPDFIERLKTGEQEESMCAACNGCYRVYREMPVRCVRHTEPVGLLAEVFGPYRREP